MNASEIALVRDLEMAASLMEEAASLLEAVGPEVLEKLPNFRWPLCDELSGAAGILRDRMSVGTERDHIAQRSLARETALNTVGPT